MWLWLILAGAGLLLWPTDKSEDQQPRPEPEEETMLRELREARKRAWELMHEEAEASGVSDGFTSRVRERAKSEGAATIILLVLQVLIPLFLEFFNLREVNGKLMKLESGNE